MIAFQRARTISPKLFSLLPLMIVVGSCAAIQPAHRDDKFVINNLGNFADHEVQRVRKELYIGLKALENYLGPMPAHKFPVIINLWPGTGTSRSAHGRGPIELYYVGEGGAPIGKWGQSEFWTKRRAIFGKK